MIIVFSIISVILLILAVLARAQKDNVFLSELMAAIYFLVSAVFALAAVTWWISPILFTIYAAIVTWCALYLGKESR